MGRSDDDRERWRRWKEATFGSEYLIWHDGLPTGSVASLRGEARAEAVDMLRLGVRLGDGHAAEALASMGATEAASEIRGQLRHASPAAVVRMARAAHALRADEGLATPVMKVLRVSASSSARMEAAIGLRDFPSPPVVEALLEAVRSDGDYLVRYHAATSFLVARGIEPADLVSHGEIFENVVTREGEAPEKARERHVRAAELLGRLGRA